MSLREKQSIFAQNVARLIEHVDTIGLHCTLGEVFRTPEQAEIYAKQGIGIKNSLHCKKLAIDIHLFDSNGKYLQEFNDYKLLGEFWQSIHKDNVWGGSWKKRDLVHFEMKDI